jgi:TRAP-type C4-dicarboxylate transport system substrate-binding protein
MNIIKQVGYVAAVFVFIGLNSASAMEATTLRLISPWSANLDMVKAAETAYIDAVREASDGAITIVRSGPEVVPPFQQLEPLGSGVFDLMISTPSYHQGDSGVGALIGGVLTADTDKLRRTGVMDWINDYYRNKFGIVVLAIFADPANQFILTRPLAEDGTLSGMKIRSNPIFEGVVRGLGATPVGLPASDIYPSMQKGVIEGTAVPLHAAADFKFYEVGKYMTRPTYGFSTRFLAANAAKFDALPEETQKLLREEALKMEDYAVANMKRIAEEQTAVMLTNGVEIIEFPAEVAQRLEGLFSTGSIEVALKSDPQAVQELIDLAKEKGVLAVE